MKKKQYRHWCVCGWHVYVSRRQMRMMAPAELRWRSRCKWRKRARAALWSKQLGRCARCGGSLVRGEAELHHLVPKGLDEEKTLDLDNVVLLCGKCHREIHGHAREGEA